MILRIATRICTRPAVLPTRGLAWGDVLFCAAYRLCAPHPLNVGRVQTASLYSERTPCVNDISSRSALADVGLPLPFVCALRLASRVEWGTKWVLEMKGTVSSDAVTAA